MAIHMALAWVGKRKIESGVADPESHRCKAESAKAINNYG